MKNFYCNKCRQQREEKEFSKWLEDESKPHLCNFCVEDAAETKPEKPVYSTQSQISVDRRKTRQGIDEFNDAKAIRDDLEL